MRDSLDDLNDAVPTSQPAVTVQVPTISCCKCRCKPENLRTRHPTVCVGQERRPATTCFGNSGVGSTTPIHQTGHDASTIACGTGWCLGGTERQTSHCTSGRKVLRLCEWQLRQRFEHIGSDDWETSADLSQMLQVLDGLCALHQDDEMRSAGRAGLCNSSRRRRETLRL